MMTTMLPEVRRKLMRQRLCKEKGLARILEAHNGLSAMVASDSKVDGKEFDGVWISSLTESTSRGLPDNESQGMSGRFALVREIIPVTNKALVVDADTGGTLDQLIYTVQALEIMGASAVVIEDKVFPKINSLEQDKVHILEKKEIFSHKIREAKKALISCDGLMIMARVEALIAGQSEEEALQRAFSYIEAGADAIVIHSNQKDPRQILSFMESYHKVATSTPLVVIPTTYNTITEKELENAGASLVIYANHLLRSAYQAMKQVAHLILTNERSYEANPYCMSIKEILSLTKL